MWKAAQVANLKMLVPCKLLMHLGSHFVCSILERPANVAYQEYDIPDDFPLHLRQYLPNTEAKIEQNYQQDLPNRYIYMFTSPLQETAK